MEIHIVPKKYMKIHKIEGFTFLKTTIKYSIISVFFEGIIISDFVDWKICIFMRNLKNVNEEESN